MWGDLKKQQQQKRVSMPISKNWNRYETLEHAAK